MITPEYLYGGIGYYVYNLSRHLNKKGHKITILTKGNIYKTQEEVIDDISIFKVPIIPIYPFHIATHGFFINKLLKKIEPDIDLLHLHSPVVPKIKLKIPIITTVHTLYKNDTSKIQYKGFRAFLERAQSLYLFQTEMHTLNQSKIITSVSRKLIGEINEYGYKKNNIYLLGNGVDIKKFYPTKNEYSNGKYILYVGRIGFRKGIFDYLKCAEIIINKYQDIKFYIVGKGVLLSKVKKTIKNHKLKDNIILLGYANEKRLIELYRNAYLLLILSYYEGLPNVLLESMSCGVPSVATNVGGIPDVISHGQNGLLCKPGDPEHFAEEVSKLIEDEDLRNVMSKNARDTIEKKFSWDKISDRVLNFYDKVLNK